jgi:hypothetical protein
MDASVRAEMSSAVPTSTVQAEPLRVGTRPKRAALPTLRKKVIAPHEKNYAAFFSSPRLSEAIASSIVCTSPKIE